MPCQCRVLGRMGLITAAKMPARVKEPQRRRRQHCNAHPTINTWQPKHNEPFFNYWKAGLPYKPRVFWKINPTTTSVMFAPTQGATRTSAATLQCPYYKNLCNNAQGAMWSGIVSKHTLVDDNIDLQYLLCTRITLPANRACKNRDFWRIGLITTRGNVCARLRSHRDQNGNIAIPILHLAERVNERVFVRLLLPNTCCFAKHVFSIS